MRLAVIPARGGSVRIPRKNIKSFFGKPIIAYSIEAAKQSGLFDEIVVSTDDEEIAAIASEWGSTTPFLRPKPLSEDSVGVVAVTRHAIEWFHEHSTDVTHACCIYATAPFLKPEFLKAGFDLLVEKKVHFTFSATRFSYPIQRAFRVTENGEPEMFWPEHYSSQSHELEAAYHDAAQFFWGTAEAFMAERVPFSAGSHPVIIPAYLVHDIDTPEDWERAERVFAAGIVKDTVEFGD